MLTGPVSQVEQFVLVSTECHGYRTEGKSCELLDQAILPDYFEIDHVRVFDDIDMKAGSSHASPTMSEDEDEKPVFMF